VIIIMKKSYFWILGVTLYLLLVMDMAWAEEGRDVKATPAAVSIAPVTEIEARAELQRLMDSSIFIASQQLLEEGTFYPYAAVMEVSGDIKLVGVPAKQDDKPTPRQTIKALKMALEQLAAKKQYRAVAIFVDFVAIRKDTGGKQAGIRIELEHRFPDQLAVFLPYYVSPDGDVSLLTPQYMPGTLHVLGVN